MMREGVWTMTLRSGKWIPLLLAAALAACAQQPARQAPPSGGQAAASAGHASSTIDYNKYVQSTVPWFQFSSLYDWDSNQRGSVVVWTTPGQAYLLTLSGPCLGLQHAFTIGLTSHSGLVSSNRDAVLAKGDRCPIIRIQRLDARAIRALRSRPKASGGKDG